MTLQGCNRATVRNLSVPADIIARKNYRGRLIMYDKKRQAIIQCWNETPKDEKKELMFRYIADHSDDYSVDLWLQFVYRELEVERLEEGLTQH